MTWVKSIHFRLYDRERYEKLSLIAHRQGLTVHECTKRLVVETIRHGSLISPTDFIVLRGLLKCQALLEGQAREDNLIGADDRVNRFLLAKGYTGASDERL